LKDVVDMMAWTQRRIEGLGGNATMLPNPAATSHRPLPPILLGEFAADPRLKTLCVYGHLDVQPAAREDGWDTDPFVLTEKDGKLYGRGSTDDKASVFLFSCRSASSLDLGFIYLTLHYLWLVRTQGPALSWLWVVEAHQKLGIALPVNLKLVYEGMEEFGSDGLFETIQDEAQKQDGFLRDVDFFCISDNYWLGKHKPCLTYGLRGLAYFAVEVKGCEQDLHSGVLGGTVHEAMTDLVRLMASLVDSSGKILVDGVMDDVKPVTPAEEALYEPIEFDLEEYKQENRIASVSNKLLRDDKKSLLMARWRFPTLSLHGIEGAFSGTGAKTVIPAKVTGKFSLRLVPDQRPSHIEQVVKKHLEREFQKVRAVSTCQREP
jgi:nonspecific dipeptidase